MMPTDRDRIATMLIDLWRGQVPTDRQLWQTCRYLDEMLRPFLAEDIVKRARKAPKKYRLSVSEALDQLLQSDPTAVNIAKSLLGISEPMSLPSTTGIPPISIHGNKNQISVGPHFGLMTQIMNFTPESQSRWPSISGKREEAFGSLQFRLELLQHRENMIEARAIGTPMGSQPHVTIQVPFLRAELDAVLVLINDIAAGKQSLTETQREILRRYKFLNNAQAPSRVLESVGQYLYNQIFVDDLRSVFDGAIDLAKRNSAPLRLQICVDEDSVMLARYPWELLHNGRRSLLASNAIGLERHIIYSEASRNLQLSSPLKVLYIAPHPHSLEPLTSGTANKSFREQLRMHEREGSLQVTELSTSTYNALIDHVQHNQVDIFHFEGHGVFGWQCRCGVNPPLVDVCMRCRSQRSDIPTQGYLAFEDTYGEADLISSSTLSTILNNRSIQLAVLLACSSGVVHGDTLFTGVAPAFIHAGIPAVVATQTEIARDAAYEFAITLYRSLVRNCTIIEAVNNARQRLLESNDWFIPVLYLRDGQ